MSLTKLYGRGAVLYHDGKNDYRAASGVLMVPPSLVARALRDGFSRTPTTDVEVDGEVQADGAGLPAATRAPAEQSIGVPAGHPQLEDNATIAKRDADAANQRAKSDQAATAGAGGGPRKKN